MRSGKFFSVFFIGLLCLRLIPDAIADEPDKTVKIGVLAFRSHDKTYDRWSPTAKALMSSTQGLSFEIVPMNYPEVNEAVSKQTIDFVLTNTGHYVELEAQFGIARIATLVKSVSDKAIKVFGGVIFTRSDREDIESLADLKGKSFLAVKKSSLGGFLVAWEQLQNKGIDPFSDFKSLEFNGMPHDGVVLRVLKGEFDAGTVRTSVIEHMIREKTVKPGDIKIISPKEIGGFPYLHSTSLYPEWPFSRLSHTDDDLVEKVTVGLLNIKRDSTAARIGQYDRWIPPLDYSAVHSMFKQLRIGPYKDYGAFTLRDVINKYLTEFILIILIFITIGISFVRILKLNRSLRKANSKVKILSGMVPICSSCKKIRDDKGFWNQIESYIEKHSEAAFSHGICPECSDRLYGNQAWYQRVKQEGDP